MNANKLEGGIGLSRMPQDVSASKPLVSIVTVSYNAASTIEDTIRSVIGQTYPNVEYVVVDGGSTDGTVDILKRYSGQIAYFVSERDRGIYDAMNKGIGLCHGDLIGIINSDDWYDPEAVETAVSGYLEDRESVQYGLLSEYLDGVEVYCGAYGPARLPTLMIPHPTCFVPKAVYDKFDKFNLSYSLAADYDLMLRLFVGKVRFRMHHRVMAHFRQGGACDSHPLVSAAEVARIRFANGVVSRGMYRVLMINAYLGAFSALLRRTAKSALRHRGKNNEK